MVVFHQSERAVLATSSTVTVQAGTTVSRAADLIGGIGVDTHIPYTDGGYANIGNVVADLAYLGIDKVRDGISDGAYGSASLSSYIALARAGVTFTFVVGGGTSTTASVDAPLAEIAALMAAVPGSVTAVEGPNEINNQALTFNGQAGLAGAVSLQRYLYQAVKGNPALAGVAVDYFTGYGAGGVAEGPDPGTTPGLADFDTQHPYPHDGEAPAGWVDPAAALSNEPGAKGPFVYTETGYTTSPTDLYGVDPTVQGKYTLDLLMDTAKAGASGTYLYQLLDAYAPGSPQGDDGYGLFNTDNSPKPAAFGIHNLTAILADTGAAATTFTPAVLPYTLSGLPQTGNSLEVAKSDGTTDIVVWAEPTLWNATTKSEVAAPSETVTVALGGLHAVSVYDPLVGTAPIATYGATAAVTLSLSDHPLIIAVGPTPVTAPAPVSIPTPVTPVAIPAPVTPVAIPAAAAAAAIPAAAAAVAIPAAVAAAAATQASVASAAAGQDAAVAAVPLGASSVGGASLLAGSGDTAAPDAAASGTQAGSADAAAVDPGFTAVTHQNGARTVEVTAPGHTVASSYRDTFLVNGAADTTFVFDPGYGLDVLKDFRINGADHDTISLLGSDFSNSVADVLRHAQGVAGGVRIVDPTSGDSIRLAGITKAQLLNNRQDFTFHDASA